jgi:hypothetical protein
MQCGHFPQALICFSPDRAFTLDHTECIDKPSPCWICLNTITCSCETLRNVRSTVIPALISLDHNWIAAGASAMCATVKIYVYIQDFRQNSTFNSPRDDARFWKAQPFRIAQLWAEISMLCCSFHNARHKKPPYLLTSCIDIFRSPGYCRIIHNYRSATVLVVTNLSHVVEFCALSIVCRSNFVNYVVYVRSIIERKHMERVAAVLREWMLDFRQNRIFWMYKQCIKQYHNISRKSTFRWW